MSFSPRPPSRSGWSLVLFWCTWSWCALIAQPWPASASEPTPSEPAPSSWLESLREADATLTELEALWPTLSGRLSELGTQLESAQKQLDSLRGALTLWQQSSAEWEQASLDSRASLERVQRLLAELTRRYGVLSRAWSDYRTEVERKTALREAAIRRWRALAIGGTAAGLLLGVLVGLLAPG